MAQSELGNITSANASLIMIVDELYPAGVVVEQFSTDQSLSMAEVTLTTSRKGVDGYMATGFTPAIYPVTVSLEASSPTWKAFSNLANKITEKKKPYKITFVFTIPAINCIVTFGPGSLRSGTLMPAGRQVLDPTTWNFDFANYTAVAI